jgi:hypothetical protein
MPADAPPPRRSFTQQMVVVGLLVAAAVIAWLIGTTVLPRWYARRIGNFVDGRMTVGWISGLLIGIVCTVVPLLVLWAGVRFRRTWQRALVFVIAALVVAAPNIVVASIIWGNGSAAHAGERILDVDGPGFRGATLVGVALGVVAFVAIFWLAVSRRRNIRKADRFRGQLGDRDRQPPS